MWSGTTMTFVLMGAVAIGVGAQELSDGNAVASGIGWCAVGIVLVALPIRRYVRLVTLDDGSTLLTVGRIAHRTKRLTADETMSVRYAPAFRASRIRILIIRLTDGSEVRVPAIQGGRPIEGAQLQPPIDRASVLRRATSPAWNLSTLTRFLPRPIEVE
jgi:hypothetical protein